jgi:beta-glucanase (GH16 family)
MKKSTFILIITSIFLGFNAHSQNNPRMENPDYAMTVFDDSFNSNWRNNWNASSNHEVFSSPNFGNILIWVDSTATIHQNLGNLYLNALEYDGYTSTDWNGHQIMADNISGQVKSKDRFLYGVFECSATFGYKHGSFPAFWLHFDAPCEYDYGSEIDIVELKYEDANPGLDNNAFYYPCAIGGFVGVPGAFKANNFNWSTETPHTFKCIWTPTKIEWYVDNTKTHTITNTGNNHYPNKTMAIILSQQLYPYNHKMNNIDVPVTSAFHWVRAKEFFLAPEITCPPVICSSDTAAMDVDLSADSIT